MTRQTARWTLPYLDIETPLARRGFCSNPILSVTLVGYQAQDLRSQPWNIFTTWDCEICQPNLGNAWILGTSGRSTHPLEVKTKLPTLQRKLAFYNLPMFTLRVF